MQLGMIMWMVFASMWTLALGIEFLPNQTWESGYISVQRPGDKLFYILLKTSNKTLEKPPLILWFNGGPGCSSLLGLFEEIGPWVVDKDKYYFRPNDYPWNTMADLLFVDQPLHVGFSLSEDNDALCRNEICVGRDFYTFLGKFFDRHPEYVGRDLYFSGESYAGRYVPAIVAYLLRSQNPAFKVKGIMLGSPSTERIVQLPTLPYYLYENEIIPGLNYTILRVGALLCQMAIKLQLPLPNGYCALGPLHQHHLINPYDIRENKTYDRIDQTLEAMLNRTEVQQLLEAEKRTYISCNETIYAWMAEEWTTSQRQDVEYLLAQKVPYMMFFGDKDGQVNWRGGEMMADSFDWYGKEGYSQATYQDWKIDNVVYGRYRQYDTFIFFRVFNAGHMMPMDLPMVSQVMLQRFLSGKFGS